MIDVLRWVLFVLTLCSDVPYLAPRSETIKQHYVGIINHSIKNSRCYFTVNGWMVLMSHDDTLKQLAVVVDEVDMASMRQSCVIFR